MNEMLAKLPVTRRLCALTLLLVACITTVTAGAEGRPPIHVQIVLDSSGSMKDNDPRRLSLLAGMLFTDLAGPNDALGVLSMRKGRFVEEPLAPAGPRRKKLRDTIRRLPFGGSTYCAEPLKLAGDGLATLAKRQPDARQFVVFLSDGDCSDGNPDASVQIRAAAQSLRSAGVQVFSIGLFGDIAADGRDPSADLQTMATQTDGAFFRAAEASDLPDRFASILGRIVGSEAQTIQMTAGQDVAVQLDGYVYDASLIATGAGRAVVVDKAEGPADVRLPLPGRATHSETGEDYYVSAHDNGFGRQYGLLRIDEPSAGTWTFRVDGPANLRGLLIQNYALDPVVELAGTRAVHPLGDPLEVRAWLRGKGGDRIADPGFLEKVTFTVTLVDPKGRSRDIDLEPDGEGMYAGAEAIDLAGGWTLRGRARMTSGGLDKRTEARRFRVEAAVLRTGPGAEKLALGDVKAGTEKTLLIDLSASSLPRAYPVTAELTLDGFSFTPGTAELSPETPQFDGTFAASAEHPGGAVEGTLAVQLQGAAVAIPVTATVIPLTFWERWGRHVIVIGAGLLGLFVLIFIVLGFVRPHRFPADSRIQWGDSMERLNKNELVIGEMQGTKSGFYRNARLRIGGPSSELAVGGVHLATLEAVGANRIMIRGEGVTLERVNKFDPAKTKPVQENEAAIEAGEIFRAGELLIRIA